MNNYSDCDSSERRKGIIPCARKSIHSYRLNDSRIDTMGSYGLKKNPKKLNTETRPSQNYSTQPQSEASTDEVDNIMSKHLRCTSSPIRNNSYLKYSSLTPSDLNNDNDDDDDSLESENDDLLARSLPTYLPSYSNCRNEINDLDLGLNNFYSLSQSNNSEFSPSNGLQNSSMNVSQQVDSSQIRTHHTIKSSSSWSNSNSLGSIEITTTRVMFSMALVVVLLAYYVDLFNILVQFNNQMFFTNGAIVYNEIKFYNDFDKLKTKYQVDQDSILQLQTGISTILKHESGGSFILAYNSGKKNFAHSQFKDFKHNIASMTAKYFQNNSAEDRYTDVNGSNLDIDTHGELIERYRKDVENTHVMLVQELDRVPGRLAMAFHYYCDEYDPLVKKSAIIFTLDMKNCHNKYDDNRHKSILYRIEACLTEKWHENVSKDTMSPLLTRVVGVVIDLTQVF